MKCYLLLFFISCFATTLTYAQDSSNLNPSPLFNPAKVNEAVDPYFGKENGRIAEMQWSYTSNDFSQGPGSNIPRISIIADDNVSRGDATYEGYDKNGAYLVRQQDGQTFRFNGKNIVKVDLPLHLYNSNHNAFDYGKNSTTTPSKKPVEEPSTAEITSIAGGKFTLKFKGGKDTTTHIVERPPMRSTVYGQIAGQKPTGYFVEKLSPTSAKPFTLYFIDAQGQHKEQFYTTQQYNAMFPKGGK